MRRKNKIAERLYATNYAIKHPILNPLGVQPTCCPIAYYDALCALPLTQLQPTKYFVSEILPVFPFPRTCAFASSKLKVTQLFRCFLVLLCRIENRSLVMQKLDLRYTHSHI